jgi:hypothetical protein
MHSYVAYGMSLHDPRLGVSVRTLERYRVRQFNTRRRSSISGCDERRRVVCSSTKEREIKDIAVVCGFSYPSGFTRGRERRGRPHAGATVACMFRDAL